MVLGHWPLKSQVHILNLIQTSEMRLNEMQPTAQCTVAQRTAAQRTPAQRTAAQRTPAHRMRLNGMESSCVCIRAGTNTPSDEYDTYREYRVANTIRIANILFLRG